MAQRLCAVERQIMKKAIVMGSVVLDITPVLGQKEKRPLEQIFAQGKVTDLSSVAVYLGGCVGNTGVAMHRLGVPVRLCCKVGNDFAGSAVETLLKKQGVPCTLMRDETLPTSVGIALTPPGMDKVSFFLKGASQYTLAADAEAAALADTDLLHFGYPTTMRSMYRQNGEELRRFMYRAKQAGVTCSMDTALPPLESEAGKIDWGPILKHVLPMTDLFVPSYEESVFMLDRPRYARTVRAQNGENFIDSATAEDAAAVADEFLAMGAKVVLLKMGSKGLYLRTAPATALRDMGRAAPSQTDWASRELWQYPADVKQIVSATGAGDVAIAGFLASMLSGGAPEEAMRAATVAASLCLRSADTSGKLLPLEEMLRMEAATGVRHRACALPDEHWPYPAKDGLRAGSRDASAYR